MKGIISMSIEEVERVKVMERLVGQVIKQKHAAKQLGISIRQVKRLVKAYRRDGAAGLVHKGRGKVGNRALAQEAKDHMTDLIRQHYGGFGPTLAWEKLTERHGVTCSDETIRHLMMTAGLWKARERKVVVLHPLRDRRLCLGELVQADGSPHDWFEGRGPYCTLLVFIDDATGKLLWLQFVESESTAAYFQAMKHYLERHGRPLVLYVDKHGVFRVNTTKAATAGVEDTNGITQFGRAMAELGIEVIFANSAEAKGRVERANQTLQDRLVKEMRLLGISAMEEANAYLPEFLEQFNGKFAVVPKSPVNMHRPLLETQRLEEILCLKYTRVLSKQLTVSYQNMICQLQTERPAYAMRNAPVVVTEDMRGTVRILYKGQSLPYTIVKKQPKAEIANSKQLNHMVDHIAQHIGIPIALVKTPWIPPRDHPWRQYRVAS